MGAKVAVLAGTDAQSQVAAATLACELSLPLVDITDASPFQYLLVKTPRRLELRDNRNGRVRPFYVDAGQLVARCKGRNLSRRQPLARAVGVRTRTVVDATAGMGQDAFRLAGMGYTVVAVEQCPLVAALLRDGLSRANDDHALHKILGGRLRIVTGDVRKVLPVTRPRPDAIYMDPMFPPKRKHSALAKKPLRILRDLVGDNDDTMELLSVCLRYAKQRVVVKRPHYAPPLPANPSTSYEGKLVRYDVYLTRG